MESRVVGNAVRDHRRLQVAVAVLVLQTFAVQRRAAGGAAEQEAARAGVAGGPGEIADALEAEHRVVDVERDHLHVVGAVRRGGGEPGRERTGFVDAFLQNLAALVLAVIHDLVGIDRLVQLADRGVDADGAEQAFHAEGTRFVRNDRHDVAAQRLVAQQRGEQAHKRHGGGDFTLAGGLQHGLESGQRRRIERRSLALAGRYITAQRSAAGLQIFHLRAVLRRPIERQMFQIGVGNRDIEAVAEGTQRLHVQFLLLVRRVLRLAGRAHAITLDRLGQNHGGLAGVLDRRRVGRVNLVRIVSAPVKAPDIGIGHRRDHILQFRIFAEEGLTRVRAALGLEILVFAIDALFHALAQDALAVHRQQRIPVRAPDHFQHVPAGAAEGSFQFLDDLAVAAHRTIEALQVAVDDEDQVVEFFPRGQRDRAQGLRLVGLAIA